MRDKPEFWYDKLKRECDGDEMEMGRRLVRDQFPGIDEKEAISYARGFTNGMIAAGYDKQKAFQSLHMIRHQDNLLNAGVSYLGLNMVEALIAEKQ